MIYYVNRNEAKTKTTCTKYNSWTTRNWRVFIAIISLWNVLSCCSRGHPYKTHLNSLRPRLNRRPFADDIFKCIFLNENVWISIKISLKFVPKGPINNIPALVQIMAWRRAGDKPLSESMMVSLPTHICVARPQWVKHKSHEISFAHNLFLICPIELKFCAERGSIFAFVCCALYNISKQFGKWIEFYWRNILGNTWWIFYMAKAPWLHANM